MTEPPLRKRFQVHLSTAIVMMFVAGGSMWANTLNWGVGIEHYGAPFLAVLKFHLGGLAPKGKDYCEIDYGALAMDLIVAILFLYSAWFLCEWLIRRRAVRNGT